MTKTEILNRIDELEGKMFLLKMADHWDEEDYELNNKWHKEIMALREKLNIERTYKITFIKPNEREYEKRVTVLGIFENLEEGEAFGKRYETEYNANIVGRRNRGYYNVNVIEVIK